MEFEHLNLFHAKHGSKFKNIRSNDRLDRVKNYIGRKFMKSEFFQYTLTKRNSEYIISQTNFLCMNPEEIFFIAGVFQLKAEKYPKMKIAFKRPCELLKALVCDFGKIDAEIHPVLANKFNFTPFDLVPYYTKGFQDMSLGATSYSELGVVYKKAIDEPKYFIPASAIHCLMKKQLDVTLASVQRSKHTTD